MDEINDNKRLKDICISALDKLNLNKPEYKKRLNLELKEIEVKEDYNYFLEIYDKGIKGMPNNKNILIPFLLGICNEFDINKEPAFFSGETPDIDVDYMPQIQQYLKNEYVPKAFGAEYVCNVGSHTTLGVKNTLLDVARIYDKDRNEVLKITKNLPVLDDDGKPLTFEEALNISPELKKYCSDNPEIKDATSKLTGKVRNYGQHAAGVIISNIKLNEFMPLITGKDDMPCSAWAEGQHSTDLSTVGLVKYDFLGSEALNKIKNCLELIKERHGIDKVCALHNMDNWSDISYLNDPKCLDMASKGDLKTTFQFDSDVARKMCKEGGVDSFDDIIAYNSLNRPGCLEMGTDQEYIKRKHGKEYTIHPLLEPILKNTYGLALYQEQLIRILHEVGKIPEHQCMEVQKAISKKKVDKFIKYKETFLTNGQVTLNQSKQEVEKLWDLIEASSKYSFNLSHSCSYSYVTSRMLWLKCYYPLEWFAAVLSSLPTGDPKIQDYRYDGVRHNLTFNKVDINKSKANFHIANDNSIYYALSKIKGIGDGMAEQIAVNQPYADFQDFLDRSGATASAIKPIIALRLFPGNPKDLFRQYELHKQLCKIKAEIKGAKEKYEPSLKLLVQDGMKDIVMLDNVEAFKDLVDKKTYKKLETVKKRYLTSIEKNKIKIELLIQSDLPDIKFDPEYEISLESHLVAEKACYGFDWENPLAKIASFDEQHFEWMESNNLDVAPINISITKVEEKKGKVRFFQVSGIDIYNFEKRINIWISDYNIWQDELFVGNMIRIRLNKPTNGFPTYTMESARYKKYVKGVNDFRIMRLK